MFYWLELGTLGHAYSGYNNDRNSRTWRAKDSELHRFPKRPPKAQKEKLLIKIILFILDFQGRGAASAMPGLCRTVGRRTLGYKQTVDSSGVVIPGFLAPF